MRGEMESGMKTAFLFSGQGAQYPGMGKDLYENYDSAKAVFDSIATDFDVKTLCFEGSKEQLDDTQYTQVAIFAHAMAAAAVLQENGIHADVTAGLSLGEYSALCYADCFSVQAGAEILRERGKLMANALPSGTSAIVITGEKAAVEACGKKCLEAGARRVIPLQVSGAFHSSLLQEAGKQLHQVLSAYELKTPRIPVLHNLTARIADRPLIDLLSEQISHSVLLEDTIRNMLADGVDTFIEVGPGKAVSGFVKKCAKGMDVNILHVEDAASLAETLDYMKG